VLLHAWSSAAYTFPLPAGHRFPIEKYALLRDAVVAEGLIAPSHLHEPARATVDELARVHTRDYIDRLTSGALSDAELRLLGFPWSPALVERSYRAVGGTLSAARSALDAGLSMNLAGGTHHAFPDRGEGFCVFNDVAITVRALRAEGRVRRAAIIDLDVHQGNGTNAIFGGDADTFTFSMHGGRNYPFNKVPGTLDVELADGTGDAEYLARLADALPRVFNEGRPDLVVYLAGADPHERDRLGRLKLTFEGLERRDAMVLEACRKVGIPVAVTIAGGYGLDVRETVAIHVATVRIASRFV
jgi:acetoin utilization deacetylase AcuC-like enzyme